MDWDGMAGAAMGRGVGPIPGCGVSLIVRVGVQSPGHGRCLGVVTLGVGVQSWAFNIIHFNKVHARCVSSVMSMQFSKHSKQATSPPPARRP